MELQNNILILANESKFKIIIEALPDDILEEYNNEIFYFEKGKAYLSINSIELGITQEEKNELALNCFLKVCDLNKENEDAYFYIGEIKRTQREYSEAIEEFSKVIRLNAQYSDAYIGRGLAYKEVQYLELALPDFEKAINITPDYGKPYLYKAQTLLILEKVDESFEFVEKAINLSTSDSDAYLLKSIILEKKGDYEEALNNLSLSIIHNTKNGEAYWRRYRINKSMGHLDELERDLKLASKYSKNSSLSVEDVYQLLDERISDAIKPLLFKQLHKVLSAFENASYKEDIKRICFEISDSQDSIKSTAKLNNIKSVIHYTKLTSLLDMIRGDYGYLRYYNAVYMNDPNEGELLLDILDPEIKRFYKSVVSRRDDQNNCYLGCFTPIKNNRGENLSDNLVMWRTYGKGEDNEDGKGCSIEIDVDFFRHSDELNKSTDVNRSVNHKQSIHQVLYFNSSNDSLEFMGERENKLCKENIKVLNNNILELLNYKKENKDENDAIDEFIFQTLSEIRYLFKSSDFAFENELRVIIYKPIDDPEINIHSIADHKSLPHKLYCNSSNYLLHYIKKVILGPKMKDKKHWMFLEYLFKKNKNYQMKIKNSTIVFQ